MKFTREQVAALCGGQFPHANGFDWSRVNEFRLEDGVLQPYAFNQLLPVPGLVAEVTQDFLYPPRTCWRFWLIQGVYFYKSEEPYLSYGGGDLHVAIRKGVSRDVFAGVLWYDPNGLPMNLSGVMQDPVGISALSNIGLGRRDLRFVKKYQHRESLIHYAFAKKDDGTWQGSWERGKSVGKACCVLIEVPDTFMLLFE